MEAEHCARFDSDEHFKTSNYGVATTPRNEWLVVARADSSRADMRAGRRVPVIADLLQLPVARDAGLDEAEVAAVVLYTGPMASHPCLSAVSPDFICIMIYMTWDFGPAQSW